jgi:hypothetical protein
MKNYVIAGLLSITISAYGQIPVTINRSTIESGGTVLLSYSGNALVLDQGGEPFGATYTFSGGTFSVISSDPENTITGITGAAQALPALHHKAVSVGNAFQTQVSVSGNPGVIFARTVPSSFTNTIRGSINFTTSSGRTVQADTSPLAFHFQVVEDGESTPGIQQSASLLGNADGITSISRKTSSTPLRKLISFELSSSTDAVLKEIAFGLSNTGPQNSVKDNLNLLDLSLFMDGDQDGIFEETDSFVKVTQEENGSAIFNELSVPVSTTPRTFFLVAKFNPSKQKKNSFITSSLRSQNIVVHIADQPITTRGATIQGKIYAFLDSTKAEEEAHFQRLKTRIGSTTTIIREEVSEDKDTSLIPAIVAGAAAVGAAFTSDSLNQEDHEPKPTYEE